MTIFNLPDYKPTHSINDFEFVHDPKDKRAKLGVGSFATVKLAKEKKSGKLYALKTIDIDSKKASKTDIQNLKMEIGIHKDLDHPNIVKFHGYIHQDNFIYLILDYAENGNLYSYLHKKKTLTEKEIFKFFEQSCLAVNYLHQNNIIHRDLKPENLLLDKDFNIKVCDFGWSAYHINQERKTFCGTYEYMAPEIVHKKTYDYRVDVWALGILLYELIHGKAPYQGRSVQEIKSSLTKCQITFDPNIQQDAKDLIQKILKDNPTSRMLIDQILSDKWVISQSEKHHPAQNLEAKAGHSGSGSKFKQTNKSLHVFTQSIHQALKIPFGKSEAPSSAVTPKGDSSMFLQERSPNLVSPSSAIVHSQPFSAMLPNHGTSNKRTPKKLFSKKIFDENLLSPTFNDRLDKIMGTLSTKNSSMIQPSQDATVDLSSSILNPEKTARANFGSNPEILQSYSNFSLENTHENPNNVNNPTALKVNIPYRFERKSHKRPSKNSLNDLQNIISPQKEMVRSKKHDISNYRSVPQSQREIPETKRIKIFDNDSSFIADRHEVRRKITFRTIEESSIAKHKASFSDKVIFENKENLVQKGKYDERTLY